MKHKDHMMTEKEMGKKMGWNAPPPVPRRKPNPMPRPVRKPKPVAPRKPR